MGLWFAGEVALPGGNREEGDVDGVEIALREAIEEIGLDPSHTGRKAAGEGEEGRSGGGR